VTGDAWRILGTGFTSRFFILVSAFLVISLLFLTPRDWWADVDVAEDEHNRLLDGIKHWDTGPLRDFIRRGAGPVPMERPSGFRKVYAYLTYLALIAFALIATALFVSVILTIVGLIMINANEAKSLAGSVDIYYRFPGIMVTKQLLSLSLSLGAFAAFFLVAAQHTDDRDEFIKGTLTRYRRALLVYTTYCRARDSAEEWTGISVELKPGKQAAPESDHQEEETVDPAFRAIA